MHLKALDHGLIVLDPRIEFLSIDNLPTVVNRLDRLAQTTNSSALR